MYGCYSPLRAIARQLRLRVFARVPGLPKMPESLIYRSALGVGDPLDGYPGRVGSI